MTDPECGEAQFAEMDAAAGPGGGAGPYSSDDDSGSTSTLDLALEAVRSSRIMTAACVDFRWKTRKATTLIRKESLALSTRAPLKPRTNQPFYPPRCPASRPSSPRTPAVSTPRALRPCAQPCAQRSALFALRLTRLTIFSVRFSEDCRAVALDASYLAKAIAKTG